MIRIVTSATVFRDSLGMRLSFTFSEADDQGHIISDNNRENRIVTDSTITREADDILAFSQQILEG